MSAAADTVVRAVSVEPAPHRCAGVADFNSARADAPARLQLPTCTNLVAYRSRSSFANTLLSEQPGPPEAPCRLLSTSLS